MTDSYLKLYDDPSLLLIFTYAPAGLGHLRVTEALSKCLPRGGATILLGARDKNITILHRLTSVSDFGRKFGQWFQHGYQERVFTAVYRRLLRKNPVSVYHQMLTLIDSRLDKPKKIIVVATHFALAHQLAEVKEKLEKDRNVRIYLIVQVTDDSPQKIWYVPGADLTFVPSIYTKDKLDQYGKKTGLPAIDLEVNPYPLSPGLSGKLNRQQFDDRKEQLDPSGSNLIHVSIPVSGAAVGLTFYKHLMMNLHSLSSRFRFHIISKKAPFTESFLDSMSKLDYVTVFSSSSDREVVNYYDELYLKYVISLEITKPSEQAFKALLKPDENGGAILLFTRPVGRQEYDNINFLIHHGLIPSSSEKDKLLRMALDSEDFQVFKNFRGMELPHGSEICAKFIQYCLNDKIFTQMTDERTKTENEKLYDHELGSRGSENFWEIIADRFLRTGES